MDSTQQGLLQDQARHLGVVLLFEVGNSGENAMRLSREANVSAFKRLTQDKNLPGLHRHNPADQRSRRRSKSGRTSGESCSTEDVRAQFMSADCAINGVFNVDHALCGGSLPLGDGLLLQPELVRKGYNTASSRDGGF